ncbi:hypothetical protein [Clostridium manihotivorum]|uniref:Uncharacterized protein n=1 Tax=Clostridium manihotivorum TaxID=2320868 RepID=A0A3R5QVV5_9CLOT|nr:hypothetical protein [Clostridium manihotivorum]QAA33467.1 hypothetical protein C1I91_18450 [Clostridium manihotivorum]
MFKETLQFYSDDSALTLQYIKGIMFLLGDIKEFEIFKNEKDSPYKTLDNNKLYSFILRDDKNNELWLKNPFCSYGKAGEYATNKILKLLGILDSFKLKEKDYVKEVNLTPIHKLNLLISTASSKSNNNNHHFWIVSNFKYAYELLKVKESLSTFGLCCAAKQKDIKVPPALKIFEPKEEPIVEKALNKHNKKEHKYDEFAINNEYVFFMHYNEKDIDTLKNIVLDIIDKYNGSYHILPV